MPHRIIYRNFTLLLFVVLLAGCAKTAEIPSQAVVEQTLPPREPSTSTPTPTPAPSPTPQPELLYEDDFSDPDSGWERYTHEDGVLDYQEGRYRMFVNAVNTYWVQAYQSHSDIRLQVQAEMIGGPQESYYGVMCRLNTETWEAYMFLVTGQGEYGIAKYTGNRLEFLGPGELQPSQIVQTGGKPNLIQADCMGNVLTLVVNGTRLLQVEDSSLQEGDTGLVAGSWNEPGVDIFFDDFQLMAP